MSTCLLLSTYTFISCPGRQIVSWPRQGSQNFLEKPKFEFKSWISWDWGRACQGKLGGCPPPKCFAIVLHWWLSGPSKADRRNFMRTLVPKSLWSCLSQPIPGSTRAEHRAMLGLALEERVKHQDKAVHQAHDWLCSYPLLWDPILWAHPSDPLNPFSVSHGAFGTSVHMPPRTRPVYQHPPPLPKHALKKPSKPASAKAQPATRRAPKNSKRPSSRASAPRPPPPLGHSPPSSALTPTATTKTPSITTSPSDHNRLGAPKAHQDRSHPPTPALQGMLPSNTPTSPL